MSESNLPAPLVPADVDLRGYEFMPYYGDRLRDSDLNSRATDAEYRAAHNLWWSSWKQVPAASLPDDDTVLARLADLGRDVKSWIRVRDVALRGFLKCSDGRFYHKVLGPLAIEAWDKRDEFQERKENERQRQKRHRDDRKRLFAELKSHGIVPSFDTATVTLREQLSRVTNGNVTVTATAKERIGEDRTGEDIKSKSATPPVPERVKPETQVCIWLTAHGVRGAQPANPKIINFAREGVTEQHIIEAVNIARVDRGKGQESLAFNYLCGILTDVMYPPERKNSAQWWATETSIDAKATEVGLKPNRGELYPQFVERIKRKIAEVSRETPGASPRAAAALVAGESQSTAEREFTDDEARISQ